MYSEEPIETLNNPKRSNETQENMTESKTAY